MDKKLIFLLIFAFACTKDKIHPNEENVSLTISNANPIQFWDIDEDSFNQKAVCSIYPVCFCQPRSCARLIRLQGEGDDISKFYFLVIIDKDNVILSTQEFSRQLVYNNSIFDYAIYDLNFTPESLSICDRSVQLFILDKFLSAYFTAPTNWMDELGAVAFSKSSTQLTKNATGGNQSLGAIQHLYSPIPKGVSVSFQLIITTIGAVNPGLYFVSIRFWNGDPNLPGSNPCNNAQSFSGLTSPNIYTENVIYTMADFDANYIEITAGLPSTPSSASLAITVPIDKVLYITDESKVKYSDCINISDNELDCNLSIDYSNSSDFAGLHFAEESPSPPTFNLEIPAIFFEENFPQEQEDLELSDDTIITLWSKIEGKKLLDIGFMPFYMHKKLQMVLMMDNVSIDGIEYRMRDPYQITAPASKRSALRRASVLLSEKDFINRNLL